MAEIKIQSHQSCLELKIVNYILASKDFSLSQPKCFLGVTIIPFLHGDIVMDWK